LAGGSALLTNTYFVYLLASRINGTLYVGVTNDLARRVWQHREGIGGAFTKKYRVHRLVWFEVHADIGAAITREKQIKKWNRAWKIQMIEQLNPRWDDLYETLV
jgi:putative endonuclease